MGVFYRGIMSKYAILRKSIMASIALIDEALTDDSSKSSSQTFDDPDATRNLLNDTNCTLDTTLSKSQPTVPTSSRKQTVTQPKKLFRNRISKCPFRHKN